MSIDPLPPPEGAPAAVASAGAPAGRRVLVVDDEVALCEMVRRMLAPLCQVDVALDAESALQRIAEARPPHDVILCDLMMPGMTGMDLYDRLLQRRPEAARRFVFMTARPGGGGGGGPALSRSRCMFPACAACLPPRS